MCVCILLVIIMHAYIYIIYKNNNIFYNYILQYVT